MSPAIIPFRVFAFDDDGVKQLDCIVLAVTLEAAKRRMLAVYGGRDFAFIAGKALTPSTLTGGTVWRLA